MSQSDPGSGPAAGVGGPEPWAHLADLDHRLRTEGFPTGPDRWQNVHDLLAALAASHRLPADPQDLRPFLASLFCRSPDEQRRFTKVFAQWLGSMAPEDVQTRGTSPLPEQPPRRSPPKTPLWPVLAGLGVCILIAALGLYLWLSPPKEPSLRPPLPVPQPAGGSPVEGSQDYRQLELEPVPPRTPSEIPRPSPEARRWLAVADWLFPVLPLLLLLAVLAWRARRRLDLLRYRRGDIDSPLCHITLAEGEDDLFTGPALRAALARLHRPVAVPTARLDESATVERSARDNGLFTPVYRDLPRVPDLVVLLEYLHRGDHLAVLGETLIGRLRGAGIEVQRYAYQHSPTPVQDPRGRPLSLADLAARHPGSRLLIIGDPTPFLEPWSGRLADWGEVLALWPRRALLATRAIPGPWRATLEASGLALAPFGEAGLMRLAGHLARAPIAPLENQDPELPGLLGTQAALDTAPDPQDRQQMLATLEAWLGPRGWWLLTAAARYPELHPGLTRVLDRALFPEEPPEIRAQRLLRLARLPWLRLGHLPAWLRLALFARTPPPQARWIGDIYRELLERASVDGEEEVRLPVVIPRRRRGTPARARLDCWLRDLIRFSRRDAVLQDRIFHATLRRPRVLDFLLPWRLARRLPRRPPGGLLAPLGLGLPLMALMYLLWHGEGPLGLSFPQAWRSWAAAAVQKAEDLSHSGFRVEIQHTPETLRLAERLREALLTRGFPGAELRILTGPVADRSNNTVQVGTAEAVAAGVFVAARLEYLAWGQPPIIANRLAEPPAGADPAQVAESPSGEIRVWLANTGHGGVFTDALIHPLDDAERARFQNPKGLQLPEPTLPRPRVLRDRLQDGAESLAPLAPLTSRLETGDTREEPRVPGQPSAGVIEPAVEVKECVVHIIRRACKGQKEMSYKQCGGKKECDKKERARDVAQCAEKAAGECSNSRLDMTHSKIVTATFDGKEVKGGLFDGGNFCSPEREDFGKCEVDPMDQTTGGPM